MEVLEPFSLCYDNGRDSKQSDFYLPSEYDRLRIFDSNIMKKAKETLWNI